MTGPDFAARRSALCLTQLEMAELFGVCVRTIRNWEAGNSRVPLVAKYAFEAWEQLTWNELDACLQHAC